MGRGRSGIGDSAAPAAPANPIADRNFDVTKQKPTNASFVDNMNEAQLIREIERVERRIGSAERERDQAYNSGSWRRFEGTVEMFPGGVGGSAVTPSYRRMVERAMAQANKGVEAQRRADDLTREASRYRQALDVVRGSGLLVHEARTARAAVGGKLAGKWTRSSNAAQDSTFGALSGQVNGDFAVSKVWGKYRAYRNGREIGAFDKSDSAKRLIETYAGRG